MNRFPIGFWNYVPITEQDAAAYRVEEAGDA